MPRLPHEPAWLARYRVVALTERDPHQLAAALWTLCDETATLLGTPPLTPGPSCVLVPDPEPPHPPAAEPPRG